MSLIGEYPKNKKEEDIFNIGINFSGLSLLLLLFSILGLIWLA
jgi:hypothetical protein